MRKGITLTQAARTNNMSRFQALQYGDFLFNRGFRRSIFCKESAANEITAAPDPQAVQHLWLRTSLEPVGPVTIAPGLGLRFCDRSTITNNTNSDKVSLIEIRYGLLQALLVISAKQAKKQFRPIKELLQKARKLIVEQPLDRASETEQIGQFIFKAAVQGQIKLAYGTQPDVPIFS